MSEHARSLPPFYINILLLNKEEMVANQVGKKTGLASGGFLGRAAAFAANKLVTDEKVISNLATTVIEKVTTTISEMGISADLKKSFQKGAFCVIKVQVKDVDKLTLILAAKGTEFASSFTSLLASLSSLGLADTVVPTIDEKVLNQVHSGMMNKFTELIPIKMKEAGLDVDCHVSSTSEQAEYFFNVLETIES